jgi:arginine decarboxylase
LPARRQAKTETLFWRTSPRADYRKIASGLDPTSGSEDIADLRNQLGSASAISRCSSRLLAIWALGALFPIVPIHRLDRRY